MGTHPIFESDFDCLTDDVMSDKKLKKGPEPLKAYVAFKHKVTYARRSPSPVTVVPSSNPPNPPPSTPVRGLSPVQSYLQSQWPRDIRNSLSNAVNSVEAQTEPQENSASDENQDACENCIIKSLTEEGKALRELKRIRQAKITKKPTQQQQQQRPASVENCSDELMAYQEPDDHVRVLMTPMDGRRPPRPSSVDSQTQTEHACSPCHSPVKSIRLHPPSPGTNRSFLFKREPPDGAEVVKPSFEATNNTNVNTANNALKVVKDNHAKIKSCFKPSPNSTFVQYKPQRPAS